MWGVFRRFLIGFGGSLSVTVGPRQAIAVHTGAKGNGVSVPNTAQQVSVIFSENATTTFGEVSNFFFAGLAWLAFVALSGHDADIGVARIFMWWAVLRSLVIGTHLTRCVCPFDNWEKITVITDQHLRGIDPAGSNQLPRVGRDGVLAAEHDVPVQVHSQRV